MECAAANADILYFKHSHSLQVECAAANADFTCPVTQDILYRIMSKGDEPYANSDDLDEIPILPPGTIVEPGAAPILPTLSVSLYTTLSNYSYYLKINFQLKT